MKLISYADDISSIIEAHFKRESPTLIVNKINFSECGKLYEIDVSFVPPVLIPTGRLKNEFSTNARAD